MMTTTRIELAGTASDQLWLRAQAGDHSAYARLILDFSPQIHASLGLAVARSRHWTRSRKDDVSDLLQEALLFLLVRGPAVVKRWHKDSEVPIEATFRLVATRIARSYLRSGRRSAWAELPSEDDGEFKAAERTEEALLARDSLRRLFAGSCSPRSLAIVRALYVEGRTLDEVCRSWRVNRNTVYCTTRRFRARAKTLVASEH
jgi:RNA polymerase sigma factor (sigma-70 family)